MLTRQELSRMLAGISATQQRQGNRLEEISERLELVAAEQAAQGNRLEEILEILRRDRPQAT